MADRLAHALLWVSVWLALAMTAVVVVERALSALLSARRAHTDRRYRGLVRAALAGDDVALGRLLASPGRHRLAVARLLIEPLIDDREPARIARTRAIVAALSFIPIANRYLRSWWWWRRAVSLRALGVLQLRDYTAAAVASLDDPHPDVRAAALDALAYLHDVASLDALAVRLHDPSLPPARRLTALAAFGPECEGFLLDLSEIDPAHRVNYARALAICGTQRSRAALARWTQDPRADVGAAAFEALVHVGLDDGTARLAIDALDSADEPVRAMAAAALSGWTDSGEAAVHLARHLDDAWPVAVRAAQSLRTMGGAGVRELQARAVHADLAGRLARQMLSAVMAAR